MSEAARITRKTAEFGSTRRRRNRTFQAVGCTALPALKTGWATRPVPPHEVSASCHPLGCRNRSGPRIWRFYAVSSDRVVPVALAAQRPLGVEVLEQGLG